MKDLVEAGVLKVDLFEVEGHLAEHYNRALQVAIGKQTSLTQFHVDKRGKSPEIAEELGNDYLQIGDSNRYVIVVSPEQKEATLVNPEFTFDDDLLRQIFMIYQSNIAIVTRVDGLYGEIKDGMHAYQSLEDLLSIKSISVDLHTPSGFLTKARELRKRVKQLQEDPALLTKEGSAHVRRMIELVGEVGDIREHNITEISTTHEIRSFASTLYGGVFVYRKVPEPVRIKRPGRKTAATNGTVPETVVVYERNGKAIKGDEHTMFLPLQKPDEVLTFLAQQGHVVIAPRDIKDRLRRHEDVLLLERGVDVASCSYEERKRALQPLYAEAPAQLTELSRLTKHEERFFDVLAECSPMTVAMFLTPVTTSPETATITARVLDRIWPHDYERMRAHDPAGLQRMYAGADPLLRNYMLKSLTQAR